ncbi:MAG: futalosine hydrolase [Chitinophagales bacterium]|nr:futalosine hydrolase [Chitinophagales bacterium]
MKLLIVSSTWQEVKPLELFLLKKDETRLYNEHAIELLITGVGGVTTSYHLGKILPVSNWDLAIQLGICGSFNPNFPIGSPVNIISDCFADLGAQSDEVFLDAFELGLIEKSRFPFEDGWLNNPHTLNCQSVTELQRVKSISVNTVSGNDVSIIKTVGRYHPDVESMEGAAFAFCCLLESIPFLQLRAISNYVEKRDRTKWNIPLAIKNLNDTAIKLLQELLTIGSEP